MKVIALINGQITSEVSAIYALHYAKVNSYELELIHFLNNRDELLNSIEEYKNKYSDKNDVPRPEHWSGWNLIPISIEFWLDGDSRIHERLKYTKDTEGNWVKSLLSP